MYSPFAGLHTIHQTFPRPVCQDIVGTVRAQIAGLGLSVKPGSRIAIAVGSRGIANLAIVVRTVVSWLRESGYHPVIVPAMGSHGNADPAGQEKILALYGITQESTGAKVDPSMEVVELPGTGFGTPIFIARSAYACDGIILINRIKPHTDFHGEIESGLAKMAVIGLGKKANATLVHRFGAAGLKEMIPPAAGRIYATGKIIFGLGIVENAYDETALIEAVPAQQLLRRESELLEYARDHMPRLPVRDIDVLVIDRIGKDISGVGMDTNIIGRIRIPGQPEALFPLIKALVACDLTEASHGNAIGIGLADVITRKLYDKINFAEMYMNARVSTFIERAKIPVVAHDEDEACAIALESCGAIERGKERIVHIRDTLHLDTVLVSTAIFNECQNGVTAACHHNC